ncbi:LuxR family transcriptional regulator [Aldersonia sp. NBC_00410]|uniref:LuxR family transcriptional regulator n=1 Tax=Aldersonia sp. NBC_00410 TaxID=2975954 RepID=UPI002256ADBB|nr:LuxR family transcriptional regulator [Aldersonia sp. NBC_00410]
MQAPDPVEQGRAAFAESSWRRAFDCLAQVDPASLTADDLELLASSAYLTGQHAESTAAWARAYDAQLATGRPDRAAGCAYWLVFGLLNRGEFASAGGWITKAMRVLDTAGIDCVQRGYLASAIAVQQLWQGRPTEALDGALAIADIAERFHDPDLRSLAGLIHSQVLVQRGEFTGGIARLDEIMVGVIGGEVSAPVAGLVFCAVIGVCNDLFDLDRAREWSSALAQFCDRQPDLIPYSAACQVHRAEIMRLHGDWTDAVLTAQRARERSVLATDQVSAGESFYLLGELRRLRGEFDASEEAYWRASEYGRDPQPGLALLRHAQGQPETAVRTIARLHSEPQPRDVLRANVLVAYVEIMVSAGDLDAAGAAAEELGRTAERYDAPYLHAVADHRGGEVLLARGEAGAALARLRKALERWRGLGAPYEAARVRELIGRACAGLGDDDSAKLEFDAARAAFTALGAVPDAARLIPVSESGAGGLTARELEVLRAVASGKTNRAVAAELFLSEKTIARHLSNIFTKLGVGTRSAATRYAFEQHLL